MTEQEDFGLTFSDEDFDRRYSTEDPTEAVAPSPTASAAANGSAPALVRSRNRFMRTLLRRRLAAGGRI